MIVHDRNHALLHRGAPGSGVLGSFHPRKWLITSPTYRVVAPCCFDGILRVLKLSLPGRGGVPLSPHPRPPAALLAKPSSSLPPAPRHDLFVSIHSSETSWSTQHLSHDLAPTQRSP
ncbi:hypothetical protein M407DRAFT_154381 [Tulasnella calospora MUT 4182]|uniref:Uncharacterized protein n=1 Tax=Tulasnella calospora MUT 4182 TaxID=1051891 RepID=A0A0C3PVD1_9AGAM|nr:hypothetical protein M407DRAFT_154381 [Tulasnella calospora MUT 4182]